MNYDKTNEINKEFLIQAVKQWIKINYPPILANVYCKQLDDMKHFAKWLETISKS